MYENTRLAVALRMGRAATGMKQQEFSDLIGVTKAMVARNEKQDLAMRAEMLVRMIFVMTKRRVQLDVFSTLDSVVFYTDRGNFQAIAVRVTRGALGLNQQEFGDWVGVSKSMIARGERDGGDLKSSAMTKISQAAFEIGIKIGYPSIVKDLTVEVGPKAIAMLAARQGGNSGEIELPEDLVPLTMQDIVDRKHRDGFKKVAHKFGESDGT